MSSPNVYYSGDIGDIMNVDWFFDVTHLQLRDVRSVEFSSQPGRGLCVTITYQNTLRIDDALIVKNPKQHTNGTLPPDRQRNVAIFAPNDIGALVWVDMEPGALREPAYLDEIGSLTHRVIMKNGGRTWAAGDAYRLMVRRVHRNAGGAMQGGNLTSTSGCGECGAFPGEQHAADCRFIRAVTDPVKQSGGYHTYPRSDFIKPKRDEADRMNDFFRGKDTW